MSPIRRFVVAERSMAPTLEPADRILAIERAPTTGAVVVADAPTGLRVVKRLIALAPATVEIADGHLLVDGTSSRHDPVGGLRGSGHWSLEGDTAFLLSDAAHRTDADSRAWGPIGLDSVVGVVVWRYRPLSRWGPVR